LHAGGDEEYIYMNKVTVNRQQGDQEKQDKGKELEVNACLVPQDDGGACGQSLGL